MINISDKTLRKIEAQTNDTFIRFPVSKLYDEDKPESSNNGNYREYAEFTSGLRYRYIMSYHGDIEPFPEWEFAENIDQWENLLLSAVIEALELSF